MLYLGCGLFWTDLDPDLDKKGSGSDPVLTGYRFCIVKIFTFSRLFIKYVSSLKSGSFLGDFQKFYVISKNFMWFPKFLCDFQNFRNSFVKQNIKQTTQ